MALAGEISVPVVEVGVVPLVVYRTEDPAVASDMTTAFVPLELAL